MAFWGFLISLSLVLSSPMAAAGEYYVAIMAAIAEAESQVKPDPPKVDVPKPVEQPVAKPKAKSTKVEWTPWAVAEKAGEGAIIYVHDNPNCAACKLAEKAMSDPRVVESMNRFNCVYVPSKHGKQWGVESYPWICLVDKDWKIIDRGPCPVTPEGILELLPPVESGE